MRTGLRTGLTRWLQVSTRFFKFATWPLKKNPRKVTAVHRVAVAHPTAHRRRQDSVKQQHVRRSDTRERGEIAGNGTFDGNVGNCTEEMEEEIADSERERRRLTKQRICAC